MNWTKQEGGLPREMMTEIIIKHLRQEEAELKQQLAGLERKRKICALLTYLIPLYELKISE